MHRKFIAIIVATAVAITGVSASQARAADAKDILGGLAAIAIIGAGVHYYNQEKRKNRTRTTRHQTYTPQPYVAQPSYPVRPLPQHVARYDLPQQCLRTFNTYSNNHPLLAPNCLKKHYKHANSLPQECKVGFWNGNKVKRAYEPACLRQKGYRVVYK